LPPPPRAPRAFEKTSKKSIFLNKYAGLIYFIVAWHAFGYLIVGYAKESAKKEGLELYQLQGKHSNYKRIDIGKNFEIKVTDESSDNK
jgi:hypothetical protein